eukprot:1184867-Prorocentrum_minimum.AAC.2
MTRSFALPLLGRRTRGQSALRQAYLPSPQHNFPTAHSLPCNSGFPHAVWHLHIFREVSGVCEGNSHSWSCLSPGTGGNLDTLRWLAAGALLMLAASSDDRTLAMARCGAASYTRRVAMDAAASVRLRLRAAELYAHMAVKTRELADPQVRK